MENDTEKAVRTESRVPLRNNSISNISQTTGGDHVHGHHAPTNTQGAGENYADQPLGKQISVQLTKEQFESLYLQPGGKGASRQEDFTKRFGNPTPFGIASFLICLTPVSCYLMGFLGTSAGALSASSGAYYFSGGLGLTIAAILEWLVGNTFPFVVFGAFGGFWLSLGFLTQPAQGIATALVTAESGVNYYNGVALWLIYWSLLTFIFFVVSWRTNIAFVILFGALDFTFWMLVAAYTKLASGQAAAADRLLKTAGAFGFVTCMSGWWILLALMLAANGLPTIPVGDLSSFMAKKRQP